MRFRYDTALLLRLAVAPFACLFKLLYALQHPNEAEFVKSHLDANEDDDDNLHKAKGLRSSPEYSWFS